MKIGWYIITKSYKGGGSKFIFHITKKVQGRFDNDWDELLNYIGEHTGGGHNYGYNIKSRYKGKKKPRVTETYTAGWEKDKNGKEKFPFVAIRKEKLVGVLRFTKTTQESLIISR